MTPFDYEDRFWPKVDRSRLTPGGCWHWTGETDDDGYGRFRINGKKVGAHRVSFILTGAELPKAMHVLHRCDNPICVNPSHLRLGTHQENMKERGERRRTASGARNGRAKLSIMQVRAIRDLAAAGGYSYSDLGELFFVDPTAISDVIRGVTWKDIA